MIECEVIQSNLLYNGAIYPTGSTIVVEKELADKLRRYLKPINSQLQKNDSKEENIDDKAIENESNETQGIPDYSSYTTQELKELVEKLNIEVEPTGKTGNAVKSDYLKALEKVE